jgi:uncharacterized protein (DUF1800 family)
MRTLSAEPELASASPDAPDGRDPAPPTEHRSRRRFLAAGVAIAASVAGAGPARAQGTTTTRDNGMRRMVRRLLQQAPPPGYDPFRPVTVTSTGWDSALVMLVRRITNGVTPEEMALARKFGFHGYLNYHLDWSRIEDTPVQAFVGQNFPNLNKDATQLYELDQGDLRREFAAATLYRAAFSKRQLYERMVEFFADHFNIEYNKIQYLRLPDDRSVARAHALGRFPDMVRASAHSPAMLEYLDNTRNRAVAPNQNYARELMELHTVGVNGGYTQDDVAELSRCLTGWTIAPRGAGFVFTPNVHDWGAKVVMGQVVPAQPETAGQLGKRDGDQVIEFLVTHPNTARYLATKMLRWLLRYDPTAGQVDAVASVYSRTGGDIPSMVRAILTPANLTATPPKYRRPYSFLLAALRATEPNVLRVDQLSNRWLTTLGQPIGSWGPPDGYPDRADFWAGGVLPRWNFASYLTTNSGDAVVDVAKFSAETADGVLDRISTQLFAGEMPDRLRNRLGAYLSAGNLGSGRIRETVALALGSSTFQWI